MEHKVPEKCKCLSYIWANILDKKDKEIICGERFKALYDSRELRKIAEDFLKEFEKNSIICPLLCKPGNNAHILLNHSDIYKKLVEPSSMHEGRDPLPFFMTLEGALTAICFYKEEKQYYICTAGGQNILNITVYYIIEKGNSHNLYKKTVKIGNNE